MDAKLHRENMKVYRAFQRLYYLTFEDNSPEKDDNILDCVKSVTSGD